MHETIGTRVHNVNEHQDDTEWSNVKCYLDLMTLDLVSVGLEDKPSQKYDDAD